MRKLRLVSIGIALMLMSLALGGGTASADSSVTVDHAHMAKWVFNNDGHSGLSSGAPVNGPGTPPGGAGSAQLTVATSSSGEIFMTPQFAGTPLANITTLAYSTYGPNTTLDATLQFDLDYDLTAATHPYQGRMIFEPYMQTGTVTPNTWETWNPADPNAKWWTSRLPSGASNSNGFCSQGNPCTLASFLSTYQHAGVMTALAPGQFGFKAGSHWNGPVTVNVANLVVGINNSNTTFNFAPGTAAATVHVSPNGDDAFCNGQTNAGFTANTAPDCSFKTIQHAVDTAVAGDTINVHAGTFPEQVSVTKDLTLTGDGAGTTTIQVPAAPTSNIPSPAGTGNGYALVSLANNATVTMSGFTLNGPWPFPGNCLPDFNGIAVYGGSTLNLSATTVSNQINSDAASYGCQQGIGIQVGRNSISQVGHAALSNVTVTGYQKNGLTIDGAGTTATVDQSTVTGPGPNTTLSLATATNGIQISRGATGSVTNSHITNNVCDEAAGGCTSDPVTGVQSAGILIYNSDGLTIQGNTLTGNDMAIYNYSQTTAGVAINKAGSSAPKKTSVREAGPKPNVAAVATPTQITGNTIANNRDENVFLDEGTVALSGNTIGGSNIGVEVISYGGEDGNAQGTLSQNEIKNATVAGIQLQLDPTATFQAKISGDSNSIHDNAIGVNNTTATPITMTNNFWGSASGPANATNKFNIGSQGNSVSANVNFIPWWSTISGTPGSFTGTSFAPVTNATHAGQFASIQTAVTNATAGDALNAAAGTFTEAVTVNTALTINGAKHGVDARTGRSTPSAETILTGGGFSLNADAITIDGFTVQNAGGTNKVGITLSAGHSGYQVLNNIIQNNTIGVYGNANGATQTLIKQNLMQHNNEAGAASGNAIYADGGSANLLIDNNTFVDNLNGGAAGFFGAAGTQHDITFSNNSLDSNLDLVNVTTATVNNNTSTSGTNGSIIIIDGGDNGVTVTGNTITGGNGSAVVVVDRNSAGANQNIDIHGNTFTGNAKNGIQIVAGGITTATLTVHTNTIAGNLLDGVNNAAPVTVDATNNWWGTITGPAHASNVGGTGNAVTDNVTFTPWCGNIACTIHYGIGTKLVYTTQPVGGTATAALATQPVVQAEDASGNLGINFTGPVALAFGANPGSATLGGTTTVNAVAGVATFTNLSVSKAGTGYTLVASSTGLTSATSNAFTVGAPIPTVSSMDINTGTVNGGTTVVITGTNFVTGDTVTFGGVAATNVQVLSDTQISVKTPAHAEGLVDVRVVNASNQGNTLAQQYHYITAADVTVPTTRGGPIGPAGNNPAPAPPSRPGGSPNPHP
jgi:hypothetical protein